MSEAGAKAELVSEQVVDGGEAGGTPAPVVATQPDSQHAKIYRAIAEQVRGALSGPGSGRAAPKIVIEA